MCAVFLDQGHAPVCLVSCRLPRKRVQVDKGLMRRQEAVEGCINVVGDVRRQGSGSLHGSALLLFALHTSSEVYARAFPVYRGAPRRR